MKKAVFLFLALTLSALPIISSAEPTKIRIGWQIPWAVQGQLKHSLANTDIPANNGLAIEWKGAIYGPDLNIMALAGDLDVVLTGDQPGLMLLFKEPGKWQIIGRLMYNRTVTYVPVNSPIKSLLDLKGKTEGLPIAASVEMNSKEALQKAGVNLKDVQIVNLGVPEQGPLVMSVKNPSAVTKWGNYDALAAFDILPAVLVTNGYARELEVSQVVSLIIANKEFLDKNLGAKVKIINAFADGYDYYRQNVKQANNWFMTEAKIKGISHEACDKAASLEPNLKAKNKKDIRMTLNDEDIARLQRVAEFLGKKNVDIKTFIREGE